MGNHFHCPDGGWNGLTPWQKLCCYRVSNESKTAGVDCDAALRSTVIYQLAFGGGKIVKRGKIWFLERSGIALRGDTMNSYATTVREYIRKIWLPDHKPEMLERGIITTTGGTGWAVSRKYCEIGGENRWDAAILDNDSFFKNILPAAAEEFFRLEHTVGNFTVLPDGCNNPRGSGATKDYWDLCLRCIRQWYQDNPDCTEPDAANHDALKKLAGGHKAVLGAWLAAFGSWDEFVERNYMQDFVNRTADGGHGEPRELWEGHFTGTVKPRKKEEFEQFFTNASVWIAARGERIALAVQAALRTEEQGTAAELPG